MRLFKVTLLVCAAAVILSGTALAQITAPSPIRISGVITAIDLTNRVVALTAPAATSNTAAVIKFFVSEKTIITKNGSPATLADLAVKDECMAQVVKRSDGSLLALTVVAKTPASQIIWVSGIISRVLPDAGEFYLKVVVTDSVLPAELWFAVSPLTRITRDGVPVPIADLRAGDVASVGYVRPPPSPLTVIRPMLALVVEARSPGAPIAHVVGKIIAIGNDGIITIIPANAPSPRKPILGGSASIGLRFFVTPSTRITKLGPASFDALMLGDMVDVAYSPVVMSIIPPAIAVTVIPSVFKGMIASVDPIKGTVVGQVSPMGPAILFHVVDRTVITKNGVVVPLKALAPRDLIAVEFFHFRIGYVAGRIDARSPIIITPG